MRLSSRLKNSIIKSIYNSFGNVDIYLFGSRVDDTKKGGDIDLAIDTAMSKKEFKANKIKFLVSMLKMGLDLKIDLVKYNQDDVLFSNEIHNNSVRIV